MSPPGQNLHFHLLMSSSCHPWWHSHPVRQTRQHHRGLSLLGSSGAHSCSHTWTIPSSNLDSKHLSPSSQPCRSRFSTASPQFLGFLEIFNVVTPPSSFLSLLPSSSSFFVQPLLHGSSSLFQCEFSQQLCLSVLCHSPLAKSQPTLNEPSHPLSPHLLQSCCLFLEIITQ